MYIPVNMYETICYILQRMEEKMHIFRQSAFQRGFSNGFASPYSLLFGEPRRYNVGKQNLVAVSWRQVGETMRRTLEEDKVKYGETARAAKNAVQRYGK